MVSIEIVGIPSQEFPFLNYPDVITFKCPSSSVPPSEQVKKKSPVVELFFCCSRLGIMVF